jgi:hypothetical protein
MNSPQADGHSPAGFPHSDISGSRPVSGSPELIAAFHVLLRLWLPRHPPYALRSLTLSLRHASRSRAGFDSRELPPLRPFDSFSLLPLDDIRSTKTFLRNVFCTIQLSMNRGGLPRRHHRRPSATPVKTFVELIGIEPTTSGLQSQRSPN